MNFAFNIALPPWMTVYNEAALIRTKDYVGSPDLPIAPRLVSGLQISWVCNVKQNCISVQVP